MPLAAGMAARLLFQDRPPLAQPGGNPFLPLRDEADQPGPPGGGEDELMAEDLSSVPRHATA